MISAARDCGWACIQVVGCRKLYAGGLVRCPRCGNENPGTNRFCGMCGATLLPAPVPVSASQSAGSTSSTRPAAVPDSPAEPPVPPPPGPSQTAPRENRPVISGPSFLGLNEPAAPTSSRRSTLSIDPNSSSRSLDYLLEDEEPRRGAAGKFLLIIIALLLAGGFGYLRWRHQGFGWLTSTTKKPPATESADQPDTTAPTPTASSTAPAANQPASPGPAISEDSGAKPANPGLSPGATSEPSKATSSGDASASGAATKSQPKASDDSSGSAAAKNDEADSESDSPDSSAPAPAAKPKPASVSTKPTAARAAGSAGVVAEAHKYLYGKGASQDCDRGLRLLKPAANRADPKAMVELGALYSAGLCTPRDLPTAYRWFALALRKEPENASVQNDLQKLWGEMTQPERQLAIKLSQ